MPLSCSHFPQIWKLSTKPVRCISWNLLVVNKPLGPRSSEFLACGCFSPRGRASSWDHVTCCLRDSCLAPQCSALSHESLGDFMGWDLIFFSRLADKAVKDYSTYRSSLLFWALVDLIYNMFKVRTQHPGGSPLWPGGALLLRRSWLSRGGGGIMFSALL